MKTGPESKPAQRIGLLSWKSRCHKGTLRLGHKDHQMANEGIGTLEPMKRD